MLKKFHQGIMKEVNDLLSQGKDAIVYRNPEYVKGERFIVEEFEQSNSKMNSTVFFHTGGILLIHQGKYCYGIGKHWTGDDFMYSLCGGVYTFGLNYKYIREQCKILCEKEREYLELKKDLTDRIKSKSAKELRKALLEMLREERFSEEKSRLYLLKEYI